MRSETVADFTSRRRNMVEVQLRRRGIKNERVLEAMGHAPRHLFVTNDFRPQAYDDNPLPIGEDQTVSQPYIVAAMLEALELQPSAKVLEVGTGSGYQTALLAEMAAQIFSIERIASLAQIAAERMKELGHRNVSIVVGDGSLGLPGYAPYDAIVVSAASPSIPQPLFEQLQEGGRMVIPVGPLSAQELQLVRKQDGQPVSTILDACRFVPLIGERGYRSGS